MDHNKLRAVQPFHSLHFCLVCQLVVGKLTLSEERPQVLKEPAIYNANSAAAADSTTAATLEAPTIPALLLAAGAGAAAGADALASAAPAVAATAPGAAAAAVAFAALGAPAQVEAGHFASALIGIVILDSCRAPEEPVAEVANRATEVAVPVHGMVSTSVKVGSGLSSAVVYARFRQGLLTRPRVPALAVSSARLGAAPKSTTTSYLPPGHSIVAGTPF